MSKLRPEQIEAGICGASAGNFAQSLGYMSRQVCYTCIYRL